MLLVSVKVGPFKPNRAGIAFQNKFCQNYFDLILYTEPILIAQFDKRCYPTWMHFVLVNLLLMKLRMQLASKPFIRLSAAFWINQCEKLNAYIKTNFKYSVLNLTF